MSIMPIWPFLRRLLQLLEQPVDRLQFLLDLQRLGIVIGVRPVKAYLAASSSIWYLSPSRATSWTNLPGEPVSLVLDAKPDPLQIVDLLLAERLAKAVTERFRAAVSARPNSR